MNSYVFENMAEVFYRMFVPADSPNVVCDLLRSFQIVPIYASNSSEPDVRYNQSQFVKGFLEAAMEMNHCQSTAYLSRVKDILSG